MKLNDKGWELYYKWESIYEAELKRLQEERNDPDYFDGWCIIDNSDFVKNIDDLVGLLCFGDDDHAIWNIVDQIYNWGCGADSEYAFGTSYRQLIDLLKPYFDISEEDEEQINCIISGKEA